MIRRLMLCLLFAVSLSADSGVDILNGFLARTGDPDTLTSKFSGTDFLFWLNQAQNKVVRLGGYIEKTSLQAYSYSSIVYKLPVGLKSIKEVIIYSDSGFHDIIPKQAEESIRMQWDISWSTADSAYLHLTRGGVIPKQTDVIFDSDSLHYRLPRDFRGALGVAIRANEDWQPVVENPFFVRDTNVAEFMVVAVGMDKYDMYLRGHGLGYDGDTVRVWYLAAPADGDTMRVKYFGVPKKLDSLPDSCEVSVDEHVFIIDEIMVYYLQSLRAHGVAAGVQQQNRQDMGITRQEKK